VKHNLKGVGVCGNNDEFGDASIKCLGGFICSLLDLLEGGTLRNKVEEF
jgi:hypothetical protein